MALDRQAIAAALSTLVDVNGYEYMPAAPRPGDAWPQLARLEHADGMAFLVEWRILVMLPQDVRAASDWIDAHYEGLVDALLPVGFVSTLEPAVLQTSAGDQQVLHITMRSEG